MGNGRSAKGKGNRGVIIISTGDKPDEILKTSKIPEDDNHHLDGIYRLCKELSIKLDKTLDETYEDIERKKYSLGTATYDRAVEASSKGVAVLVYESPELEFFLPNTLSELQRRILYLTIHKMKQYRFCIAQNGNTDYISLEELEEIINKKNLMSRK